MRKRKISIEERERLDYQAFENLIELYGNKTTPHKMPQFSSYDCWTEKDQQTVAVIELKTREEYHINSFPTFLLSLKKIDQLQEGKTLNDAHRAILVAFYPLDNKTVIFDLSDLKSTDVTVEWRYVYITEYEPEKGKEWQPFAVLNLQQGQHKNYSTKIINQKLGFLLEK